MMKKIYKAGLIGNPVGHSVSPFIHSLLYTASNIEGEYRLFEPEKDELEKQKNFFLKEGYRGFNVTIPYKTDIVSFCDNLDEFAKKLGAVNTVKIQDGKLIGYNTDFYGLKMAVTEKNINVKGKKCVLFGAGGAARSAGAVLVNSGAEKVYIFNRTFEHGKKLAEVINDVFDCEVCEAVESQDALMKALSNGGNESEKYIALQATSIGLKGEKAIITADDFYKNLEAAIDIVPMESTDFLDRAAKEGAVTLNGFSMLFYQAVKAFEIFNDVTVDKDKCEKAYAAFINTKGIAFVGFMGAGKSTAGFAFSQKVNFPFAEMDLLISEKEGMSIPGIFDKYGEEYFRSVETKVLLSLAEDRQRNVVSCGGGICGKLENIDILKNHFFTVYLKNDFETLYSRITGDANRPLTKKSKEELFLLFQNREKAYEECADVVIEANGKTVEEIIKMTLVSLLSI